MQQLLSLSIALFAGLMLSPLFGFTPDELYLARKEKRKTLWESVKAYSESNPENSNFSKFISTLNRYRSISEGMKVDELIQRLYSETHRVLCGADFSFPAQHSPVFLFYYVSFCSPFSALSLSHLHDIISISFRLR